MTHRNFVIEFARVKKTPFFEVPLGSVLWHKVPIADVLNIRPSYTRFNIDIFECKVNRCNLMKEIKSEKWKKYLPYCNRFYFVTYKGLTDKIEIPEECGLILKSDKSFYTRKPAPVRNPDIDIEMLMSLIFMRKRTNKNSEHRHWLSLKSDLELKKLGKKINTALNEYEQKPWKNAELKRRYSGIEKSDEKRIPSLNRSKTNQGCGFS